MLTLDHEGWVELFGRSAGIQERPGLAIASPEPDSGWAEGEAARLIERRGPAVWLVLSYLYGFEFDILDAMDRRGARRTYWERIGDIELVRYQLPESATP